MGTITIDMNKLQKYHNSPDAAADAAPTEDELRSDPKSALARFGVEIDDEMHDSIKQKLDAHSAAKGGLQSEVQAGAIHVDIG